MLVYQRVYIYMLGVSRICTFYSSRSSKVCKYMPRSQSCPGRWCFADWWPLFDLHKGKLSGLQIQVWLYKYRLNVYIGIRAKKKVLSYLPFSSECPFLGWWSFSSLPVQSGFNPSYVYWPVRTTSLKYGGALLGYSLRGNISIWGPHKKKLLESLNQQNQKMQNL